MIASNTMDPLCQLSDIKQWLQSALLDQNLTDFSVKILGNSEKGDGYLGDILFINVSAKTAKNQPKEYNLVLKCGKKSEKLRESLPVRETFENEIFLYKNVFVAFDKFQRDKGLNKFFDSVPKCYGTFLGENMEVLVLENLRMLGYSLFDRKKALTTQHINLILEAYGKWHALSAAMQDQKPEEFSELTDNIKDLFGKFRESGMDVEKFFGSPIDEIYDLVENDIDLEAKKKLKGLKEQINFVMNELIYHRQYFSVITHGDGWNNNFMFKYEDSDHEKPTTVAILDWQLSKFTSPVTDLSYFLYSCISSEDLEDFDNFLRIYYESFSGSLRQLGSDPDRIYPLSQLLADWKIFAKFGIIMAFLIVKIAVTEKEEAADIAETIESGLDMSDTFGYSLKNKDLLKNRILCVVKHVIERDLI